MMDLKGFWMRVNTRAPPAPPKQLSGTTADGVDAHGECGDAELSCARRAHMRLYFVAVVLYTIASIRIIRKSARNARKKHHCKHNTACLQAFGMRQWCERYCEISAFRGC